MIPSPKEIPNEKCSVFMDVYLLKNRQQIDPLPPLEFPISLHGRGMDFS